MVEGPFRSRPGASETLFAGSDWPTEKSETLFPRNGIEFRTLGSVAARKLILPLFVRSYEPSDRLISIGTCFTRTPTHTLIHIYCPSGFRRRLLSSVHPSIHASPESPSGRKQSQKATAQPETPFRSCSKGAQARVRQSVSTKETRTEAPRASPASLKSVGRCSGTGRSNAAPSK